MGRPAIYTPQAFDQIRRWVADGLSPEDIAARLGSTVGSLKSRCSESGISLRRASVLAAIFDRKDSVMLHLPISRKAMQKLRVQATMRDMHADALAGMIIEIIANDDMFAAIIDD